MHPLVSAAELMDLTARAGADPSALAPVLLEVRWQLGGPPGRLAYEAGHLPGAVHVDLDTELAGPAGSGGRHPLPDPAVFGAAMRRAGVSRSRTVVVLDGGAGWAAARAWWLLRWAGHPAVRVLDGGLPAWTAAGGALTTEEPEAAEGDFTPEPGALPLLDADAAAELARRGLLLDARAGERYRGEVEPVDPVAGHIPGAVNLPSTSLLAGGRFRDHDELRRLVRDLAIDPETDVAAYCGSGVTAAVVVAALASIGVDAALFPGSWSQWCSEPGRPVEVGAGQGRSR